MDNSQLKGESEALCLRNGGTPTYWRLLALSAYLLQKQPLKVLGRVLGNNPRLLLHHHGITSSIAHLLKIACHHARR